MNAFICLTMLWVGMVSTEDTDFSMVKAATDQFSARMFSEVARLNSQNRKSFVLSTFSVLPPLSMLAVAAAPESKTHDELKNALGYDNDNAIISANRELISHVYSATGVVINVANRIFMRNNAALNPFFLGMQKEFNTSLVNIDFGNVQNSVATINAWVEEKTNHKIVNLVNADDVKPFTELILVNALYFVGYWKKVFASTQGGVFHKTETTYVTVPMMSGEGSHGYCNNTELDALILEMSYNGTGASFVVILPNSIDGIDSLLEKITDPLKLNEAINCISPNTKVVVTIPRFKIETETDLTEVLKNMGVNGLFNSAEIVKLMNPYGPVSVNAIKQKTYISVDEAGTEAAAATKVVVVGSSGTPSMDFKADHPFFFMIRTANLTLFSGVYYG